MKVLVVTFDSLPASMLGCYGSEWVETPNFDHLASESVVFDQHFGSDFCPIDSTSILRHAWWTGERFNHGDPFVNALREAGVRSSILSEPALAGEADRLPDESGLIRYVESRGTNDDPPFARLVDSAVDWFADRSEATEPELLWLMSAGLPEEPTAPDDFLDVYADDFDQDDERLFNAAYVTFLDHCFGRLLKSIHQQQSPDFIVVAAAEGGPASTPEQIGGPKIELSEAVTRTPLIIHSSETVALSGNRSSALTQTIDLAATLCGIFGVNFNGGSSKALLPVLQGEKLQHHEQLSMQLCHTGWKSFRSENWHFVQDFESDGESLDDEDDDDVPRRSWLFSKPEDVWDCHDVKADFHDVALEMSKRLKQ